jgi:hypothetical protein
MSKWEQHVLLTRLIKQHPDWDDKQILEAAGMKPLEADMLAVARREVETEQVPGVVRSDRSY